MKIRKLLGGLILSTVLAAGIGVFMNANDQKPVTAKADSTYITGTRVYIQDKWGASGWTGDNKNACMDMYNISFATGSGYSLSNIKLNDLYAQSFAVGSTWMHVEMKWTNGDSGCRQYEAIIPWFITGFKCKFYATENSTDRYVCNKNGGAVFEYTFSRGQNVAIYFSNGSWGGSSYYTNDSYNKLSDSYTYEFNGIKSGSHMYLSTSDLTGWEDAGAKIGICFGKSNVNEGQAWSSQYNTAHSALSQTFCWKVQGSGNSHLYECIVPQYNGQDVYWSMVIGVRFSSSASSLGWSNVLNQTGDQFYNGDDKDCNMLWVNAATGGSWTGGGYLRTDKTISDDTRAGYYGTYFLSQITCSGAGSITSSSTNWTNVKNEYKQHLSTDVEGKVWVSSGASSGTDLVKAMYRYDYIVFFKQYSGYDDFINRATSTGKSFSVVNNPVLATVGQNASTVLIVVVVSAVSLAAIGGYFLFRKKKEN